jgi:di/tricarboxylate transporter
MESDDFSALQEVPVRLSQPRNWWLGALTIPAVVLISALGVMPILKASILGAVLLLVTRSVRTQQAFKAIEWTVIFLLAAILPLGTAMEKTGLAGDIAQGLTAFGRDLGEWGILAVMIGGTMVITGFISNNAAAVLMVPIAFSVADSLGVSPKPLLMGVTFAASMSFFTPMGYQTNTMVYAPGGYRFLDYLRMGGPLNILLWLLTSLMIPWIWPF